METNYRHGDEELGLEDLEFTLYCTGFEADDEVFIDFGKGGGETRMEQGRRERRVSDVIDSVGGVPPGPSTPRATGGSSSDAGYESSAASPSRLTPKWFRYSTSAVADVTDAKPIYGGRSYVETVTRQAMMPVSLESDVYNMDHKRRGLALIINHDTFSCEMPPREGSSIDVDALSGVYKALGFDVDIHHNLTLQEILSLITKVAALDHSDCDCLLVTVLTHGMKGNLLYATDFVYPADTLWLPFTADRCTSLAGKPKLFFVQACRGEALDSGIKMVSQTQTDSACSTYKIPAMADFLITYSTAEGYYSWRHPEKGTWFIQSLCSVFTEYLLGPIPTELDLVRLLTRVAHRVATTYESFSDICPEQHAQKQVPNIHSTLIRELYLSQKKNSPNIDI